MTQLINYLLMTRLFVEQPRLHRVCYQWSLPCLASRPGRSQGLLYKQPRDSFSQSVSDPFPLTALQCRHAQTVRDSSSSYEIDYVIVIKNFLNPEGHQNFISGSKVTAILLKGWILPLVELHRGRVCACSLRSRLVFI